MTHCSICTCRGLGMTGRRRRKGEREGGREGEREREREGEGGMDGRR